MDYLNKIFNLKEPEDESIIKLSKYLGERNLRLIDFLKIMDRANALEISVDEFLRRIKVVILLMTQAFESIIITFKKL